MGGRGGEGDLAMSDRERDEAGLDLEAAWARMLEDPRDGQAQELLSDHVHRQAVG